jgi:hypothetical protein
MRCARSKNGHSSKPKLATIQESSAVLYRTVLACAKSGIDARADFPVRFFVPFRQKTPNKK